MISTETSEANAKPTTLERLRKHSAIVAGALALGIPVFVGACGSTQKSGESNPTAAATATGNTLSPSATPEATSQPSPNQLVDGHFPIDLTAHEQLFLTNIFSVGSYENFNFYADYFPEVAKELGITKTEAILNDQQRQYVLKIMTEVRQSDPTAYNKNNGLYYAALMLEKPCQALIKCALPDSANPKGSNSKTVTFSYNGQTHKMNANSMLYFLGNAEQNREQDATIKSLKGTISDLTKIKIEGPNSPQLDNIADRVGAYYDELIQLSQYEKELTFFTTKPFNQFPPKFFSY
jgi:hypothetical protein